MKLNATRMVIFTALFFIMSVATYGQQPPVSGGYSNQPTNDRYVQYAAGFAVKTRAESEHLEITLVRVARAQSQVVAGTNYRLCLAVKIVDEGQNADDAEEVSVLAVVYRNLQGEYKLTSWEETDCSGS